MLKAVLCVLCIALLSASCLKKNTGCTYTSNNTIAPASEQKAVTDYLDSNHNTNAVKYNNGLYYEIVSMGSGGSPNLCSQITVNYTGKLTNGNVFDSQTGTVLTLGALIEGWKTGLPLIQKGGSIKLYIPPSLGYGPVDVRDGATVVVPANSVLIFNITLMDYK